MYMCSFQKTYTFKRNIKTNPQWTNSHSSDLNRKPVSHFKASRDQREPRAPFVSATGSFIRADPGWWSDLEEYLQHPGPAVTVMALSLSSEGISFEGCGESNAERPSPRACVHSLASLLAASLFQRHVHLKWDSEMMGKTSNWFFLTYRSLFKVST